LRETIAATKTAAMRKRNTIRKVGKNVVTFDDSGTGVPVSSSEPRTKPGHGPSARGPPLGEKLLTVQEVAALLHCSVSALNKWRIFGRGPRFIKVERRVRYRPSDIAAYVAASARASTSQEEKTLAY
jgi:predicted DNA-binding transcriptional regulator AlpA